MRDSIAYADHYIDSDTRQLFLWGVGGVRWCERKDANGVWIRGVLLEPTASQLCRYTRSHDLWTLTAMTVPTTNATAPDISSTADVLHEDGTLASDHYALLPPTVAPTANTTYVLSTFAAPFNRNWLNLGFYTVETGWKWAYYDVLNRIASPTGLTMDASGIDSEPCGVYYRCWGRVTTGASVTNPYLVVGVAQDAGVRVFNGLNQDSLYAWGSDFKAGLYPSSHIINDGLATVIRSVDSPLHYTLSVPDAQQYSFVVEVMLPSHTPPVIGSDLQILTISDDTIRNMLVLSAEENTGKFKVTLTKDGAAAGSVVVDKVITDGYVHRLFVSFEPRCLIAYVDHDDYNTSSAASVDVPKGLTHVTLLQCGGIVGELRPIVPKAFTAPWEIAYHRQALVHGGWV